MSDSPASPACLLSPVTLLAGCLRDVYIDDIKCASTILDNRRPRGVYDVSTSATIEVEVKSTDIRCSSVPQPSRIMA